MIKNAIVYQASEGLSIEENAAQGLSFTPCAPSQEKSIGWIPPRHNGTELIESVAGHYVLQAAIETKSVPADVLNRLVETTASKVEESTGRKPGRKELKEIREMARAELLPHAFPKRTNCYVLIEEKSRRIIIGAGSQGVADEVLSMLVETFDGLSISLLDTTHSPAKAMTEWLCDDESRPDTFAIGRGVELKSTGEDKATVKFANHHLETEKMREHIAQGKLPTKLDLEWSDRISFTLTEGMQLKKIKLLDVAIAERDEAEGDFDADVAIFAAEIGNLLNDLIDVLGGEQA